MSYEKIEDNFIEGISSSFANLGLNKMAGKIYAYITVNGRPTSLQDMGDFLRSSKGNISINVRVLEEIGAIKKVWMKGDRKDYYEGVLDIWQFMGYLLYRNASETIGETEVTVGKTIEMLQSNIKTFSNDERDRSRIWMQNLQQFKGTFGYAKEISKELSEYKGYINLQKLRTIWSMVKTQLTK